MPFVTLNCAAIPESLIESELFGYGAGTFTGGLKAGKVGKIQASDGGTLFLDEIGDMPIELQARLLRVLAESEIIPLGEVSPVKVNLNVICATHRDLKTLVGEEISVRICSTVLAVSRSTCLVYESATINQRSYPKYCMNCVLKMILNI